MSNLTTEDAPETEALSSAERRKQRDRERRAASREAAKESKPQEGAEAGATEPTEAQIQAYLERTGQIAVIQTSPDAPIPTEAKAEPKKIQQRTINEAVALPEEDDHDTFTLIADPDHDYVKVHSNDHEAFKGHNDRGPGFYRSIGFRRVPIAARAEQDVVLVLPNGHREPIRSEIVLMARHKSLGIKEREAERRLNDPRRDDPSDVHLTSKPGGHFYEEKTPIKYKEIGDALPDRDPDAELAASRARVELSPRASAVLDQIERAANNLTDD